MEKDPINLNKASTLHAKNQLLKINKINKIPDGNQLLITIDRKMPQNEKIEEEESYD